jgi:hypothetical protein
MESGSELSRFRFLIDPLLLLLVVTMIQHRKLPAKDAKYAKGILKKLFSRVSRVSRARDVE